VLTVFWPVSGRYDDFADEVGEFLVVLARHVFVFGEIHGGGALDFTELFRVLVVGLDGLGVAEGREGEAGGEDGEDCFHDNGSISVKLKWVRK